MRIVMFIMSVAFIVAALISYYVTGFDVLVGVMIVASFVAMLFYHSLVLLKKAKGTLDATQWEIYMSEIAEHIMAILVLVIFTAIFLLFQFKN